MGSKIDQYLRIADSDYLEFQYFLKNIFHITVKLEGGDKIHKVSGDSGGWTLFGIAYNKNKDLFDGFKDFEDTNYKEAAAIAYCRYYLPVGSKIADTTIKLDLFDMAYNLGSVQAIKLVQRHFGLLQDGVLGSITIGKYKELTPETILKIRTSFYYRLIAGNSILQKFIKGWLNRSNYIFKIKE